MSTIWTFTIDLKHVIPVVSGIMVFISILLAGTKIDHPKVMRNQLWAWSLGIASQVILQGFAVLTGYFTFTVYMLPALAFVWNMYKGTRKPEPLKMPKVISDDESLKLESDIKRMSQPGGIIRTLDQPVPVPKWRVGIDDQSEKER